MKGDTEAGPRGSRLVEEKDRAGREGLQLDARELLWHCPNDVCPLVRSLPKALRTDCSWITTFHLP